MIYLHKILPVFVLPVGFCVVLMVVGLVWRRRGICWLGMAILLAAGIPVVGDGLMLAAEGPQQPGIEEIGHAEAIVVLAGGLRQHTEGGIPQWSEQTVNRFESGVALLKAGKAPFLLLTKGAVPWDRCALPIQDTLMVRAKEMGVAEEKLKTTRVARNTAEEALAVAEAMRDGEAVGGKKEIILVTSAFHMSRATLLFERAGFVVTPFSADFRVCRKRSLTVLDFLPCADGLKQTETALREWYGYAYYALSH